MNIKDTRLIKISPSDINELLELSKQTFEETYARSNTKENMENYLSNNFSKEKLSEEINNPNSEFFFAKTKNKTIGYLKINSGDAQTDLKDSKSVEIERIYVLKEFHGMKAGQILLEKAIEIAKDFHADYIWLGVWERNNRAINFYTKNGFVQFGKHSFKLGDDEQMDILMKLSLKD